METPETSTDATPVESVVASPVTMARPARAPLGVFGFSLFTLLLFWPTGIPAVLNAVRSREAWVDGSDEGYLAARKRSLMWSWISVGIVVGIFVLYMFAVMVLIAGLAGGLDATYDYGTTI